MGASLVELKILSAKTPMPFAVPFRKIQDQKSAREVIISRSGCSPDAKIVIYTKDDLHVIHWDDWEDIISEGGSYVVDIDDAYFKHIMSKPVAERVAYIGANAYINDAPGRPAPSKAVSNAPAGSSTGPKAAPTQQAVQQKTDAVVGKSGPSGKTNPPAAAAPDSQTPVRAPVVQSAPLEPPRSPVKRSTTTFVPSIPISGNFDASFCKLNVLKLTKEQKATAFSTGPPPGELVHIKVGQSMNVPEGKPEDGKVKQASKPTDAINKVTKAMARTEIDPKINSGSDNASSLTMSKIAAQAPGKGPTNKAPIIGRETLSFVKSTASFSQISENILKGAYKKEAEDQPQKPDPVPMKESVPKQEPAPKKESVSKQEPVPKQEPISMQEPVSMQGPIRNEKDDPVTFFKGLKTSSPTSMFLELINPEEMEKGGLKLIDDALLLEIPFAYTIENVLVFLGKPPACTKLLVLGRHRGGYNEVYSFTPNSPLCKTVLENLNIENGTPISWIDMPQIGDDEN